MAIKAKKQMVTFKQTEEAVTRKGHRGGLWDS